MHEISSRPSIFRDLGSFVCDVLKTSLGNWDVLRPFKTVRCLQPVVFSLVKHSFKTLFSKGMPSEAIIHLTPIDVYYTFPYFIPTTTSLKCTIPKNKLRLPVSVHDTHKCFGFLKWFLTWENSFSSHALSYTMTLLSRRSYVSFEVVGASVTHDKHTESIIVF